MLWWLVDGLAIVLALGVLAIGFPGRRARTWRKAFFERALERRQSSKARPRRDSSSTT